MRVQNSASCPSARLLTVLILALSHALASGFAIGLGGGRTPSQSDQPSLDGDDQLDDSPAAISEAKLQIIQITDVYTLQNFPSLKTMIAEKKAQATPGSKVISVLTGDFLAPYLLSSVDKGAGMMNAIAKTPIVSVIAHARKLIHAIQVAVACLVLLIEGDRFSSPHMIVPM